MNKLLITILLLTLITQTYSQKYVQVWGDEFNTPGRPDSKKWDFEIGKVRNGELQYYTDRTENSRIEDTTLIIEARKESYQGAAYTSASLVSRYKGDWLYGKMEFSAKVPGGKGTWPAIWMMPSEDIYGTWPKSGEIDIMEYVGMNPDNLYYTVHYEGTNGSGHQSSGYNTTAIRQPYNQFIKFTLYWTPTKIEWWANDKKYFTYNKPAVASSKNWPFDKMFYLILNLAYGGSWGGQNGVDDTKLPHKFYIDYVRVYQLQETDGPFSLEVKQATGGTAEVTPVQPDYASETMVTLTAKAADGYEFEKWDNLGFANPLSMKVINNATVTPVFKKKNEQLVNGDFSNGLNGWSNWSEASVSPVFTTSATDSVFVANITKPGTSDWHIVTQQGNLALTLGQEYILTFDAWAENPNSLRVFFAKNSGDYGEYYATNKSISKTKTTYTWKFKMLKPSDSNCRFSFGLGMFKGNLYIDNVSIQKVAATGTGTFQQTDGFEIFPNPSSGEISITSKFPEVLSVTIKLYNLQGQLISTLCSNQTINANQQLGFNLKNYSINKGIYFLTISTSEGKFSQKVIVY